MVLDEGKPTAGVIIIRIALRVPVVDKAKIVINTLRSYAGKLQGSCCFLTESSFDIHRPTKLRLVKKGP
jgi:hypothetical protein